MKEGEIKLAPNNPTLFDLIELVRAVSQINDRYFTKQVAVTLARINNPPMYFISDPTKGLE